MRFLSFVSICAALIACSVGSVDADAAASCSVSSPAHRVALVELYTSEGCSSCPPADNWLSALDHARHADTVVPLALHVDYWDSLGWKDRFAQAGFSARQRQLSEAGRQHVVYTPEVFIDGREMREWSDDADFAATIRQLNAEASPVDIHIDAQHAQPGRVTFDARFKSPGTASNGLVAYAVVYENRLDSDVKAGENAGVMLHHNRVVRQWIGPVALANGQAAITGNYSGDPKQTGVVAFAQNPTTGEVLQAVELPDCAN
jgi:hypothetical protein